MKAVSADFLPVACTSFCPVVQHFMFVVTDPCNYQATHTNNSLSFPLVLDNTKTVDYLWDRSLHISFFLCFTRSFVSLLCFFFSYMKKEFNFLSLIPLPHSVGASDITLRENKEIREAERWSHLLSYCEPLSIFFLAPSQIRYIFQPLGRKGNFISCSNFCQRWLQFINQPFLSKKRIVSVPLISSEGGSNFNGGVSSLNPEGFEVQRYMLSLCSWTRHFHPHCAHC